MKPIFAVFSLSWRFFKCKDQEVPEVKHDTSSKRALEPVEPIPLPKRSRLSVKMIWYIS
jgi:hypothetical protein